MISIVLWAGAMFGGLLFQQSFLTTHAFSTLAAFVAINTVMYAAMALAKILPKIYVADWFTHRNRRSETRSIYPDSPD
jgi:hypothetical protein